jgi:hypothetical protein
MMLYMFGVHPLASPFLSVCTRITPYLLNKMRLQAGKYQAEKGPSPSRDLGGSWETRWKCYYYLATYFSLYGPCFLTVIECVHTNMELVNFLFDAQLLFFFLKGNLHLICSLSQRISSCRSRKRRQAIAKPFFCVKNSQFCMAFPSHIVVVPRYIN